MNLELVKPSIEYESSYLSYLSELTDNNEKSIPFVLGKDCSHFKNFITLLIDYSQGKNLEKGFVPHSTFWLIKDKKEVIGVSNIRHELTASLKSVGGHIGYGIRPLERKKGYGAKLLAKSLIEAKNLGINNALLTCSADNPASKKVILKNGGIFESEDYIKNLGLSIQRYYINIGKKGI